MGAPVRMSETPISGAADGGTGSFWSPRHTVNKRGILVMLLMRMDEADWDQVLDTT